MKRVIALLFLAAATVCGGPVQTMQQLAILQAKRASGAAPSGYTDNFDAYATSSSLAAAANWTAVTGAWLIYKPASNGYARANTSGDESCIRYSAGTFASNQYSEVMFAVLGASNGAVGPAVRCQTGAVSYYGCYWNKANSTIYVFRMVAGTWTEITTYTSKTYVTGNKLKLQASGAGSATRLALYEDVGSGWAALGTNINPGGTYLDNGTPGVTGYDTGSNTGPHLDTWGAGDL